VDDLISHRSPAVTWTLMHRSPAATWTFWAGKIRRSRKPTTTRSDDFDVGRTDSKEKDRSRATFQTSHVFEAPAALWYRQPADFARFLRRRCLLRLLALWPTQVSTHLCRLLSGARVTRETQIMLLSAQNTGALNCAVFSFSLQSDYEYMHLTYVGLRRTRRAHVLTDAVARRHRR